MVPAFSVLDEDLSTPGGLVARLGRGVKKKPSTRLSFYCTSLSRE